MSQRTMKFMDCCLSRILQDQFTVRSVSRLIIVTASIVICAINLYSGVYLLSEPFRLDFDEGVFLCSATALLDGHAPYSEVFIAQPPAFPRLLALALRIGGETVSAGRALSVGAGVVALLSTFIITWRLTGSLVSGMWGLFVLSLSDAWFVQSRTVQPEAVAMGSGLAAIALLCCSTRPLITGLAGTLFGVGLMSKPLVAPLALPLVALCLRSNRLPWSSVRMRFAPLLAFLVGSAVVATVLLLSVDLASMWEQAIAFHRDARRGAPSAVAQRARMLVAAVADNRALCLAAIGGLYARRGFASSFTWHVTLWWLLASGTAIVWQYPVFMHHTVLLLPPLIVAAASLWRSLVSVQDDLPLVFVAFLSLFLVSCVVYCTDRRTDRYLQAADDFGEERDVLATLRDLTATRDSILSDDPMQTFRIGRRAVPWTCDVSHTRLVSGYLPTAELIESAQQSTAIVFWTGRLEADATFVKWVKARWRLVKVYPATSGSLREVYSAR